MNEVIQAELIQMLITIIWALVGALSMGVSLGILIKFFDWLTPVNEWNQIKSGNMAMGIILAAVIIAFGMVISTISLPQEFTITLRTQVPIVQEQVQNVVNNEKVEKNIMK